MIKRLLFILFVLLLPFVSDAQTYLMNNSTVNTCSGTFYDSGGNAGNYANNTNSTMTFCSGVAGNCVRLQFTSLNIERGYDSLFIYNGPSILSPVLASLSGNIGTITYTATSGCLTIRFVSDGTIAKPGWAASISCVNCITGGCTSTCVSGIPPVNDACSGAINIGLLPVPVACPDGTGAVSVTNGSNFCATAEPGYVSIGGCQPSGNMASPAADVWYQFNITGPTLNVSLVGMQTPTVGLYSGNCGSLIARNCAIGSGGSLNTIFTGLTPGSYYMQISGGSLTDQCDFTLSMQNNFDCNQCVILSTLGAVPSPVNGTYSPGQTVQFCYTINSYNQSAVNWLHGLVPIFGAGWDMSTLTTVPPVSCSNSGVWKWYSSPITSSQTGIVAGPGFFFETDIGNALGVADANPGNNFGDSNTGSCTWTFCWTIKALPQANCIPGVSLNMGVNSYGDGESGSWSNSGCVGDPIITTPATTSCCPPPTLVITNPNCAGTNSGSVVATGLGTAPWTYVWKNAGGTTIQSAGGVNGTNTINSLAAGNYSITVTNASGCTATVSFSLVAPAALTTSLSVTPVTCNGGSNGTATVVTNGGTPTYSYAWSPSGTGSAPTGLTAATYTVTVTDSKGCTSTSFAAINQSTAVSALITASTNAACFGGTTGSVTVTAGGGTPGYTYLWSNGNTNTTATGLAAATYTVTVTDTKGCTKNTTVNILQPSIINLALSSTPASCGSNNGTASVIAGGGTGAFSYAWSPAGGTSANASGLGSGGFSVIVTDANGCTSLGNIAIANSTGPTASISSFTDVTCFGGNNGSSTASAVNGTLPYSYVWSTGSLTASSNSLSAGTFTVTVTDGTGCTSTASVVISEPPIVTANITGNTPANCFGSANGTLTVQASGGTPNYSYLWSNGNVTTNATSLLSGNYTVTITDSKGCTITTSANVGQPALLIVTLSSITDVTCNGGSNGTATATGVGGLLPYAYSWSTGSTNNTITGLAVGTYTVTVSNGNSCTAQTSIVIKEPVNVVPTISSSSDATCNATATGSASVSVIGGVAPLAYLWSPSGGSSATASNIYAGAYTVLVTDANGCTGDASVTINEPTTITINITAQTNVLCNSDNNGAATINAIGGTPVFSYAWTPLGGIGSSITSVTAGIYTVTVTDANGCTNSLPVNITEPVLLKASITANVPVTCNGGNTGSLTVTPIDGVAPYSYVWSTGDLTASANSLVIGTYTVTVTDANGCTITKQASITEPTLITLATGSTSANCGSANGTASVVANGGTPTYTYLWSPSGGTGANATALIAGGYDVTVTDANGCTVTANVVVPNATGPTATLDVSSDVTCFGGNNGSGSIQVANGLAPFSYQWSPNVSTGLSAVNLSAATYTVTVTDANGCSSSTSVVINEPSQLNVAANLVSNALCNGSADGSLLAAANGGTPSYSYAWSSGDLVASATGLIAGTYTVTTTDANGCTATNQQIITEPTLVVAQITNTSPALCNGGNTGSFNAFGSGGIAPYTFLWNDGTTANSLSNLFAGNYTVTVTDANGCSSSISSTVVEPPPINLVMGSTSANCGSANGTASAVANGGTPTYTYSWSPSGGTGANAAALIAGGYDVTVTDANGCTATANVVVPNAGGPVITLVSFIDVLCNGNNTGDANISVNGGLAPYVYAWSTTNGSGTSATTLTAGSYTVTVTDANSCSALLNIVINEPSPLVLTNGIVNDILCNGGNTGSAEVIANGGTLPYKYLWSNGSIGSNANALTVGNYTVTVTDGNGCSSQLSFTINEPSLLSANLISSTDATCNGLSDGSITVNGNGGTPAYSFLWSNSNLTSTTNNLSAGSYTVTITDNNGCSATLTKVINQPSPISLSLVSQTDVICNGGNNGSISLNTVGGTIPYNYSWSTSGSTTLTASNLIAGNYTTTVTDINGCTTTITNSITEPTLLTLSVNNFTDVLCYSGNNGSIQLTSNGGVPGYLYQWNSSASVSSFAFNLIAGNYTATVTDQNGCTATVSQTISEPLLLQANITPVDANCFGAATGSATVFANGGISPYSYSWFPGGTITSSINNLIAGNYDVIITDQNACTLKVSTLINEPTSIQLVTGSVPASCGSTNGSVNVVATGGAGGYTYLWDPGASTSNNVLNVGAGAYTVTVTDNNGCSAITNANVNNLGGPSIAIASSNDVSCFGFSDGAAQVNIISGNGPYSINWAPSGGSTVNAASLIAGNYSVNVTDINGCTASVPVTINEPTQLSILANPTTAHCGNPDGASATQINGGTSPYTFAWSNSSSTIDNAINLLPGNFTVTVTDSHNCSASVQSIIPNAVGPIASIATTNDATCFGKADGNISINVNGGIGPYSYLWSNAAITNSISGLVAGTYTVTATDVSGCTSSVSAIIAEPAKLLLITNNTTATCGSANGSAQVIVAGGVLPYNYSWSSGGSISANALNLNAGLYTVTVTDANGCSSSTNTNVANAGGPVLSQGAITNITCFGGSNGSASVNVTSGNAPFQFNWAPAGGNAATGNGLSSGNNLVTVTDINGCSSVLNFLIAEPTALTVSNLTTDVSCYAGADGTANIDALGGTMPYVYDWNPGGILSANRSSLPAGNYTVIVTDALGCSAQTIANVKQPTVVAYSPTITDAKCNGVANGNIQLTVNGGISPYNFTWSNGVISSSVISNLSAGLFTVTVSDNNGCSSSTNYQVNEPTAIAIQQVTVPATCGTANGSANVTANGGTGALSFQWSSGLSNSNAIANVIAGTYSVTVTDQNGCTQSTAVTIANQGGPTASITSINNVLCKGGNNASATVNVTAGNGPFQFIWTPFGGNTSTGNGLTAGNYTVEIHDINNCITTIPVLITEPPLLSVQLNNNPTTCGFSNGNLSVTANGGNSSYIYNWSNGASTAILNNIASGKYYITVTDANGCSIKDSSIVNNISGPSLSVSTKSDVKCYNGNDGTASVTAQNGLTPYQYSWSSIGLNTANATGLIAGIYTVTVTDGNGCTSLTSVQINQPAAIQLQTNTTASTCNGSNGSASVISSGGTGNYLYNWSNGATTAFASGLTTGNYTVTVTDQLGCTSFTSVNVPVLSGPTASIASNLDVHCNGGHDGSASIFVNNGTSPYQYLWSQFGGTNSLATNLTAGNYTVTVTDANGCSDTVNVTIVEPTLVTASIGFVTPVTCFGGNNGQITAVPGGGISPYQYHWSNGMNGITASNLNIGNYTVTITDSNGCTAQNSATINQPATLNIASTNSTNVSCFNGSNGSATLSINGGTSPYTYLWSNGNTVNNSITNLIAGNYTVTVTDNNGCKIQNTYSIIQPTVLSIPPAIIQNVKCHGDSTGSASITTNGGVSPYIYNWSNGSTGNSVNHLWAGNYTITVTDFNGCTLSQIISIIEPNLLELQAQQSDVICYGQSNGVLKVLPTGGVGPYSINWNSSIANGFNNTQLPAGTYSATITDMQSCLVDSTWIIGQPLPLSLTVTIPAKICIGQVATLNAIVSGGTVAYTYVWSNGFTGATQSVNPTISTNYTLTVSDQNGCSINPLTIPVAVNPPLSLNLNLSTDSICKGDNVTLTTLASGGNGGPYNYQWNNITLNTPHQTVSPDSTTLYQVSVSDACGTPIVQAQTLITVTPSPIVSFTPLILEGCSPVIAYFNSTSNTTANSTYYWSFGDNTFGSVKSPSHTYVDDGTYTVSLMVTNSYGCSNTLSQNQIITVHPLPIAFYTPNPQKTSILTPVITFDNQSTGGNYFDWNFGDGNTTKDFLPTHTFQDTGRYHVELIATTLFGCKDTFFSEILITKDLSVYIPNAFTPNGDDKNDFFTAYGVGMVSGEFLIFDRWGSVIYKGDLDHPWLGESSDNGETCQVGVYVYLFHIKAMDGATYEYSGRVSLIK